MRKFQGTCLFVVLLVGAVANAQELPQVESVDRQPLLAAVERVAMALESVGRPLSEDQNKKLSDLKQSTDDSEVVREIQKLLDPLCLVAVHINPESRVKVAEGPVAKTLIQNGWSTFLVKVHNEAGINPAIRCSSPQAKPQFVRSNDSAEPKSEITMADVKDRWLSIEMPVRQPMKATLSGLALEYRIVQLYSRDTGKREASFSFDIGQGTQDLGFRNDVAILFDCREGHKVTFDVRDSTEEQPMMVALEIRDDQGRVYPNPARRLAPDFFFHNQVYRKMGETISLPSGEYTIKVSRGPEYLPITKTLTVADKNAVFSAKLERWIDPIQWGWYSGDHHVHAAGCAHYQNPTAGVGAIDMMRHVLGEDLKVGCVLSWGPCWYEQKKNFDGNVSPLSTPQYLMRYDVEVSGFPSSHAGHLCLLRLTEDDYPGTTRIEQWPTWTLPVLKWGKRQGGVVGYSHSGWGLALPDYLPDGSRAELGKKQFEPQSGGRAAVKLPDYAMPRFDGIGANEFVVTVAHDVCDFYSTVDTPAIWELNMWYHSLNCGFRSRISGETDFPCIYGERVGLGRVYVQLTDDQPLEFDAWVDGLKDGRSYCGDGMSHVVRFAANANDTTVEMGKPGSDEKISQLNLDSAGTVKIESWVSARLEEKQSESGKSIQSRRLDYKPYWHIERSRIGQSRNVKVELVVNGQAVQEKEIVADGSLQKLTWDVDIEHSSWVAIRIFPTVHTNPIFVVVGDKPIRASRKSAQWCRRKAVDVCWASKSPQISEKERGAAKKAYDEAAAIYEKIIAESVDDE